MNLSAAEPWVRLGLVQGRSRIEQWELAGGQGPAMIVVGASTGCNWVVEETGVAPLHFSIYWDGRTLRISRNPGAPGLQVDGETVWFEWRVLSQSARIDFGGAAIVVELPGPSIPVGPAVTRDKPPSADGPGPVQEQRPQGEPERSTLPGPAAAKSPPVAPAVATPAEASRAAGAASVRAPKPTLLGMAYTAPPPAPSGTPAHAGSDATLGPSPRASDAAPVAVLGAADQHPMLESSGAGAAPPVTVSVGGSRSSRPPERRDTPRDMVRPAPQGVMQAPMRSISDPAPTTQERVVRPVPDAHAPTEVMDVSAAPTHTAPLSAAMPRSELGPPRRPSQAPIDTTPPSIGSNRPARPFPWHYAFVGVLTVVAYFAWLYLLDHF